MAKKKTTAAKGKALQLGTIPKLSLTMPIDEKKAKAIQACIAKGALKITLNKVDLHTGKIGEAWLYD